jgi:tRNA (guanine37-N1)-methyltransferase
MGCFYFVTIKAITMIKIQVISLFPEMFEAVLGSSMLARAKTKGLVDYSLIDLRYYGLGPRQQVDDTPYGGGEGMLLKPEPIVAAIEQARLVDPSAEVLLPSPRGVTYKQSDAKALAGSSHGLVIICSRYEGYDERIMDWVDKAYSVGNYVLTGGEIPAMTIIDSVVRLIPGVLGSEQSTEIESFQDDDMNIEFPQYTRPETFNGKDVPKILLSGNHAAIENWRKLNSKRA